MKEGPSSAVEISEASQNLIMRRTVMAAVTDISSCPLLSDTYILETVLPLTLSVEGGKTAKAGEFFADFCAISPRICTCCQCHVGSGTVRNWYTGMKPSKMQEGTVFSWASLKGPTMHTVLCYAVL